MKDFIIKNIDDLSKSLLSLHRYTKITIALITDIGLCIISTWFAFYLRLEKFIFLNEYNLYPAIFSVIIAIPVFWVFGLYRTIFRYTGLSIVFVVLSSTLFYGFLYFLLITVFGIKEVPRSIGIIQPMILFFVIISSRLCARYLLTKNYNRKNFSKKKNVLLYGAGSAGRQLVIALENSLEFKVVGFLDDNKQLQKQVLFGRKVYSPLKLDKLINQKEVLYVFLAMPSISRAKRNQIIKNLSRFKLVVNTLPSISEMVDGSISISDIKDLNVNDLLSREEVKSDFNLLTKNIGSKIVLVTGAGGSIGSELCRQIINLNPKRLLLIEFNEFALYKIYNELLNLDTNIKLYPLLVDAKDQVKLELIFDTFKVETIYHAAAYKHVSLVEENICEGVKNNVYSTLSVIKASLSNDISTLVLISSDKAVRPTNVMGASKRLSELCMQGFYKDAKNITTSFSIVRFGNVLDSSGSVIPKFKKQIKDGGPITLTHKDVTRYFMTTTEASQLVIQAGAMGNHSEVFVLDMGKGVKIKDLVYKITTLSGLTVKDSENPDGDIEIEITGLRPGEKLIEELLIGENPQKTIHPKIKKIDDPYIPLNQLEKYLDHLDSLLKKNDEKNVKVLLKKVIKSINLEDKIIDHIYLEKISSKDD